MEAIKVKNVIDFDLIKALHVIEHDQSLSDIFKGGDNLQYDLLYTSAKQNTLSPQIVERIKGVFDQIILLNKKPRIAYLKLKNEGVSGEVIEGVNEEKPDKPTKLPKHYGKKRIMSDIEANKGRTELDRAMLALNKLRNIYAKLKRRGIKDKLTGSSELSTTDCREIIAAVRTLENKINRTLKK